MLTQLALSYHLNLLQRFIISSSKFDYASYLIVFVYLFEEAAHVLTGGLQRDRGVGLMT